MVENSGGDGGGDAAAVPASSQLSQLFYWSAYSASRAGRGGALNRQLVPACLSACQQSDNNVKVDDVKCVRIRSVGWFVGVQSSLSAACLHVCSPRQCEPCLTPPTHAKHVAHWHQHKPHRCQSHKTTQNLYLHPSSGNEKKLATCINYAKIVNSMLRMRGHVPPAFLIGSKFWLYK